MTIQMFNGALTGAFQPSQPIMLTAERFTIDWLLTVAAGAVAVLEWYLEFASDDPNAASTQWFREVAEEDATGGDVNMPKVVRTFEENGGGGLTAATTHGLSTQFVRAHNFVRVQVRLLSGAATTAQILARFGLPAISP